MTLFVTGLFIGVALTLVITRSLAVRLGREGAREVVRALDEHGRQEFDSWDGESDDDTDTTSVDGLYRYLEDGLRERGNAFQVSPRAMKSLMCALRELKSYTAPTEEKAP